MPFVELEHEADSQTLSSVASKVLFLLYCSIFVCSICKFVRDLLSGFRWPMGLYNLILFSLVTIG